MKRWLVIGTLFALASIDACGSGPDLAKNAPDVNIVSVASNNCGGGCGNFISGVALGSGNAYAMLQNESNGGSPTVASVDFGARSAQVSAWTAVSGGPGTPGISTDYDIAPAGGGDLIWAGDPAFVFVSTTQENQITLYSATESTVQTPNAIGHFVASLPLLATGSSGNDGGTGPGPSTNNQVFLSGLAADSDAIYVEYAQGTSTVTTNGNGNSPDSPFFPGSSPNDVHDAGGLSRIDRKTQTTSGSLAQFYLMPSVANHVLAQSKTELYFPDQGPPDRSDVPLRILSAAKSTFGTAPPVEIWNLPNPQKTVVVAIAASDAYVAWTTSSFPGPGEHAGCQIYASAHDSPAAVLYQGAPSADATACSGLAVDDTYAYVATTSDFNQPNNGGGGSIVTIGTGIMRVPLAGGSPQLLSLQSQRWYGPRRVLVDDTYVYAVDPGFVARFPKKDF